VQVFYQRAVGQKWTNVYHSTGADIGVVDTAVADFLVPDLQPMLDSSCQIVKTLVSDPASDDFIEHVLSEAGTSTASGDLLPLFNSAKVFFRAGVIGRPDYKFIKGFITESIQTNGLITSGALGALETGFTTVIADMLAADTPLCSESGDLWTDVNAQEEVQMRQMHRKRRRSVTP
jgi:hypothetical protein